MHSFEWFFRYPITKLLFKLVCFQKTILAFSEMYRLLPLSLLSCSAYIIIYNNVPIQTEKSNLF